MYDGLDPRHTEHKFGRGSPKEHLGMSTSQSRLG
jgi:hypothetical protein